MEWFFRIIKLIIILGILPYLVGMVPAFWIDRRRRRKTTVYVSGLIVLLAVFQLIAVPVIINIGDGFPLIVTLFTVITIVMAVSGCSLAYVEYRKYGEVGFGKTESITPSTREERVYWGIAVVLILLQVVMAAFTQYIDGDDAYYVVESLLTNETDTLYRIKPYTGLSTGMDLRHGLASMPIWIAYIARITGIHSTVVAHLIIPILFIPVLYMIYYQCGRILFRKERKKLPIFMIFVSIMHIFGNVSIYTNATFAMTRTWQGKSMLANLVLVSIIWLLMAIYESEELSREWRLGYWLVLFFANIVAAMCSTSSVFLVAMLIGIAGVIMGIHKRDVQVPLRLMITCVPLVAYGAMFMLI